MSTSMESKYQYLSHICKYLEAFLSLRGNKPTCGLLSEGNKQEYTQIEHLTTQVSTINNQYSEIYIQSFHGIFQVVT